jgi:hypothetical protein
LVSLSKLDFRRNAQTILCKQTEPVERPVHHLPAKQRAATDYAELARLGRVTLARMTQIMKLLDLAPDIQEVLGGLAVLPSGSPTKRRSRGGFIGRTKR